VTLSGTPARKVLATGWLNGLEVTAGGTGSCRTPGWCPHPGAQLSLFEDGWRYSLWVTDLPVTMPGKVGVGAQELLRDSGE
jgi:hypothetical protein